MLQLITLESLDQGYLHSSTLLKLLIGLAVENPQLQFASATDIKVGHFPYHFSNLSNNFIFVPLSFIVSKYNDKGFSIFGANFFRALKLAMGAGLFRSEPLSLSGYMMDFEVLIGHDGKPIQTPRNQKYILMQKALKSVGALRETESITSFSLEKQTMPLLLDDLKLSETESSTMSCDGRSPLDGVNHLVRNKTVNLASDWGQYFIKPHAMPKIARKVAFELNGPVHYAVNVPGHIRGKDVVKKRQLEALGWEVIRVSVHHK